MTYEQIKSLKRNDKTLKLINSDNVAMIVSFFYFAFIKEKNISLTQSAITNMLDDYLYDLNSRYEKLFARGAKEYLEEWTSGSSAYLRKYHGSEDEPLFELTPYSYKAIEFF